MGKEIKKLTDEETEKISGGNARGTDAISKGIGWVIGYYRKAKCETCHKNYNYYSQHDYKYNYPGQWYVKPKSKEGFRYVYEGTFCPECMGKELIRRFPK